MGLEPHLRSRLHQSFKTSAKRSDQDQVTYPFWGFDFAGLFMSSSKSPLPSIKDYPDIDFHESMEEMPAIYFLGRISIEWNYCEHLIGTLVWHYVGGIDRGLAVTSNLG